MNKLIQFIVTRCVRHLTCLELKEAYSERAALQRERAYLELRGFAARAAFRIGDYLNAPLRTVGRKYFAFILTVYGYFIMLATFMNATSEGRFVLKPWVGELHMLSLYLPLSLLVVATVMYLCYRLLSDHSWEMILNLFRFVCAQRHGWMRHRTLMCGAGLWIGCRAGELASRQGMPWHFCSSVAVLIFLAFLPLAVCTVRRRK